MDRFSIREVVEMALQTEKLGYRFYTDMAARFAEHEGLKDLFTTLANMEVKHERTFAALLGKISDVEPEGWEEAQYYMRAMVESEFFLGSSTSLPNMDHVKTVADATDFAIGFEKETTLFFTGLKAAVKDKAIVEEIIQEELSHIAWLSKFKKSL